MNATKAAVSEGIIAGGGSSYIHAQKKINEMMAGLEGDEKTGAAIVAKALEAPLYTIAENAGVDGAVIVNTVKESPVGTGYQAVTEEYVDMLKAGVIDPVKVTKNALANAVSVSSTLLTTEAAVADIKEKNPAAGAMPPEDY